jgi:endonuclease YncB( thermonuclease family)
MSQTFDPVAPSPASNRVRVIDGDTVALNGTTYRLVGFDTPEIYSIENPCPAELGLGRVASNLLRSVAAELQITPVPCWDGKPKDRYGRTCAQASFQGRNVADIMVEQGLADRLPTDVPGHRRDWCKRPR